MTNILWWYHVLTIEKLYFNGYLTEGFVNTIEKKSQELKGFFRMLLISWVYFSKMVYIQIIKIFYRITW